MNILFLSAWFPYPPDNGSKIRIYNLLRGLAEYHQVTLVTFADRFPVDIPEPLRALCEAVHVLPARVYHPNSLRALLGLFRLKPRVLVDRHDALMAERIAYELRSRRFDLVIASQWYMAAYLERNAGVPAVFEEVEVGVFQDQVEQAGGRLPRLRHQLTTWKMQAYFQRLLPRFAACTVASEAERQLLAGMVPGYRGVEVIPNGVRLADYSDDFGQPQPGRLIFCGAFSYAPNFEAMRWFVQEVLPRVRAACPEVELYITGDSAGKTLPDSPGVHHAGFVEDVRPWVACSWASLAPLQVGGGTRLKILEAMALGTPVIATSKGAQGLEAVPGEHLLVADSPEQFAEAVIQLLEQPGLHQQLATAAGELVRAKYDWQVIMPRFLEVVDRAAAGVKR